MLWEPRTRGGGVQKPALEGNCCSEKPGPSSAGHGKSAQSEGFQEEKTATRTATLLSLDGSPKDGDLRRGTCREPGLASWPGRVILAGDQHPPGH